METKFIPLAIEIYPNGHIFILAAPSKEAFISSFKQHIKSLADQLDSDATNTTNIIIRCHQAAFIGRAYLELTQ